MREAMSIYLRSKGIVLGSNDSGRNPNSALTRR